MTHYTKIGGKDYEIVSGRTLVKGKGWEITSGRTLVKGKGYDISFYKRIGKLPVGETVYMNIGGVPYGFIIVNQGNPDTSIYDTSCDGTWLLMENCYTAAPFDADRNNIFEGSTIYDYLNTDFLNLFDTDFMKSAIIPHVFRRGSGSYVDENVEEYKNGADAVDGNGLSAKIFLLSPKEVGFSRSDYLHHDGSCLSYFIGTNPNDDDAKRIAHYGGVKTPWYLRTPNSFGGGGSSEEVFGVNEEGDFYYYYKSYMSQGIRPALIVPSETRVNKDYKLVE